MRKKDKYSFILNYFSEKQPNVSSELVYKNAYELLVATILAAQCTDKRVNLVTPTLFEKYPTVDKLAIADLSDVQIIIKSISYPNNKAKHLISMAQKVVNDYNCIIPNDIEGLTSLPGVGRKTANVVLAFAFDQAAMPVDTHVFRVSHRIGLVSDKEKTPESVEKVLIKNIPTEYISRAHHWLLLHGRYTCTAKKPDCEKCEIKEVCDYYSKNR